MFETVESLRKNGKVSGFMPQAKFDELYKKMIVAWGYRGFYLSKQIRWGCVQFDAVKKPARSVKQ